MAQMRIQSPYEYEPKRSNRFELIFGDDEFIEPWVVQTVGAPSLTINSVPIEYMNTKTYVAGKFEWGEVSITFLDHIGPSTSQKIMEWVRLSSESLTGRQGYAFGYLKDLYLNRLDPTGVAVERWKYHKCLVKSANFGDSDYGNDELVKPSITVQPQFCQLLY